MYTVEDFIEQVNKSNGLVCYGVGKMFRSFQEIFRGHEILNQVVACIDREAASYKEGIDFNGRKIKVYFPGELRSFKEKNNILLITNAYYDEVIEALNAEGLLDGIRYYCFAHIEGMFWEADAMKKQIPENCRITKEQVIPKVIHYCWFGKKPIPEKHRRWMESWHKFCPDYEIREWNEKNYDITKNEYMYEAYRERKWGFVPDYARLDIIYQYGGIYLDTDVELIQNFDDMLYQKGFCGFEANNSVALGLAFGAAKGFDVVKEMRDEYQGRKFIKEDGELNLTPSPVYQTAYLEKRGLVCNGEYQIVNGMVVYPEKMFSGKSGYTRRIRITNYTKSIHHYEASWVDERKRKSFMLFEQEMNN